MACPNHFFMDWFSEHHLGILNEAGSACFGRDVAFALQIQEAAPSELTPLTRSRKSAGLPAGSISPAACARRPARRRRCGPPRRNLNPDYTFANFVVGSGTDLAYAAAMAVAPQAGGHFNPLFFHGGVGLGKTHLMHAIGNAIAERGRRRRFCYVSAEKFMNDLIKSIRGSARSFR